MSEKTDAPHNGSANGAPPNGNAPGTSENQDEKNPLAPLKEKARTDSSKKGPAGGFDDTPIPRAPPGYTVKITLHRATNLPLADINTLSADPYVIAELHTSLPTRHKEDPPLQRRTPTIRQETDPVWNAEWIIANVPASGFRLKCRIYDEDPADHDDRLGNVHVVVDSLNEDWSGIREQSYPIKKRMASKRAYLLRALAVCFNKAEHMHGEMFVSVEVLGRTQDENGGRVYTVGPQYWIRHYSPLLGRLLGQKSPNEEGSSSAASEKKKKKKKPERYNFQANQMQLRGPTPEAMYHRYVEFKPFVKAMFTAKGFRGYILSKALHHQHTRVYNFDRETAFESFPEPCKEFTQKFLELVHHDQGGRIFTYVLTLDGLFRFTETGKEFGIDMLSKHTMHSDVAAYIAFSGEFFIRRLKHPQNKPPEEGGHNESHPPDEISGGPPKDQPVKDPSYYELIIDNDSGTYRPNAQLLPQLKSFFESNFPGLHVLTLDCQADADKMDKMKKEQRERKKVEGDHIVYKQISRSSSMSSSDIEDLERLEDQDSREPHFRHQVQGLMAGKGDAMKMHAKDYKPSNNREGWRSKDHPARHDDASQAEGVAQSNGEETAGTTQQGPSNS
ncbi:uncharacterized protein N0V89_012477 [Didymosphaeria variabile]|uniref:C2 domain-containing protein n=1 Tax=Didymosphaeria variabile TaxID=1932322 RepID=A0A9W8X9H5_9PLEO|nr:uncharacterized protein N0V89_012477 [Didymosphaeria variabile]KAJ4344733.1 hypothetical protein N0V89_012477 [Didymosphaeria variabile]